MPRSAARFQRIGEWIPQGEEVVHDSHGNVYAVVMEAADTVEASTGIVSKKGRWRVRVKARKGIKRPRTRSYSGELREELASMRVVEITNLLASRHVPRVLQRSLTQENRSSKMSANSGR